MGSLLAVGVLLFGCTPQSEPPPDVSPPETTSKAQAADEDEPEITMELATWDEMQDWVAEQSGKVVVVDVWSTWCAPCLREFPHFVTLHNELGDKVACASVSIDYYGTEGDPPPEIRDAVRSLLESNNATMQNFLSRDQDEEILRQIDVASIPATLVYDAGGELRKVFSNDDAEYGEGEEGYTYERDVRPFVEGLLAE